MRKKKEIAKRYSSLKDLTISSASSDSSDSELDKDEEADLEEEAARYERDRYDPDWSYKTNPLKKGGWGSAGKRVKSKVLTAPPLTLSIQEKRNPQKLVNKVPHFAQRFGRKLD